jgi:GWxTD domain-containing protein
MRITFSYIFCLILLSLILCSFSLTAQDSSDKNNSVITAKEYLNHHKTELKNNRPTLETTINFISCVVRYQLTNFYVEAEKAYFSTLEHLELPQENAYVEKELNHTMLIADKQTKDKFDYLLRSDYKKLVYELKLFWKQRNPNPEFEYNIRFFEHWERLIYAKDNFTYRRNSIIDTDDRGVVFVKYGAPSTADSGILPYNSQRVRGWMREFDVINTGWSGNREVNNAFLSNLVSQFYTTPYYDLWIYEGITDRSLIYLFGSDGNSGQFGIRSSPEEMIPTNSFRARDELRRFNTGPSLFLQLMIYDYFSLYDPFFNDAFQDLESQLLSSVNVRSPELSRSKMHQHSSEISRIQNLAPYQKSDYLSNLRDLTLDFESYLTFNEDGQPVYYSFLAIEMAEILKDEELYPIRFSLFNNLDLLNYSFFDTLLHTVPDKNVILSFEADNPGSITLNSYSEGFFLREFYPTTQMSHNQITFTTDYDTPDSVWVGDLITGKRFHEKDEVYNNTLLPFNIGTDQITAELDILTFYLGIRNTFKENDVFRYQMDIHIEKKDRKFLFIPLRKKTNFAYSITAEISSPRDIQIIEVDTFELSSGNYTLKVSVNYENSLGPVLRKKDFNIK